MRNRFLSAVAILCLALLVSVAAMYVGLLGSRPRVLAAPVEPFPGVVYDRIALSEPRPNMLHLVAIDLTTPGLRFLVTPPDADSPRDHFARKTSTFLQQHQAQIAINGSFFYPFHSNSPWDYYPKAGDPVSVTGLSISDGEAYGKPKTGWPVVCMEGNEVAISAEGCPATTEQAISGNAIFLQDGAFVASVNKPAYNQELHPRTAVGLSADGQTLWLILVDGRQGSYSGGMALSELAEALQGVDIATALNFDGGGSTTLVMATDDGSRILNSPIQTRIPGRERPIANHLGIFLPSKE